MDGQVDAALEGRTMCKLGALLLVGLLIGCSAGSQSAGTYCHHVVTQGKVGQKMLVARPCS